MDGPALGPAFGLGFAFVGPVVGFAIPVAGLLDPVAGFAIPVAGVDPVPGFAIPVPGMVDPVVDFAVSAASFAFLVDRFGFAAAVGPVFLSVPEPAGWFSAADGALELPVLAPVPAPVAVLPPTTDGRGRRLRAGVAQPGVRGACAGCGVGGSGVSGDGGQEKRGGVRGGGGVSGLEGGGRGDEGGVKGLWVG